MRQFCGSLDVGNLAAPLALLIRLGKSYAPHMAAEVGEGTRLMLGRARRRTPRLMWVVMNLFSRQEKVTLFSFWLFSEAIKLLEANRILVLERGCNSDFEVVSLAMLWFFRVLIEKML